jgi:hypothetical protein
MSITVSGNLKDVATGIVSSGSWVRFVIRGAAGNQPFVAGTALLAPAGASTWYKDFTPDATGAISGSLYSKSEVSVGGQTGVISYGMQIFVNSGVTGPEVLVDASQNININNPNLLSVLPVVAAPTGDSTYARLDAGNTPFTGAVQFNSSAKPNADDTNVLGDLTHRWKASLGTTTAKIFNKAIYGAYSYGALGDGSTDDTTAIQAALDAAHTAGGGVVALGQGTFIVSQLGLRDGVTLKGVGRNGTTLKLKAGANTDILIRNAADTGLNVEVSDLTVDGNENNNTQGGIFWDGPNNMGGPSITFQRMKITAMRHIVGAGGLQTAILIQGNVWIVMRDLDIRTNTYPVNLWHKGSDSLFDGLYIQGSSTTNQSVVIQGGGGNSFIRCYFGGNGGLEQVQVAGSTGNTFVDCINDSGWQGGYIFKDSAGVSSSGNRIIGGQITNSSQVTNNTYDGLSFQDASSKNIVIGVEFDNRLANKGRYGISETGTAGNNLISGCTFGRTNAFVTASANLRSGGGTAAWLNNGLANTALSTLLLSGSSSGTATLNAPATGGITSTLPSTAGTLGVIIASGTSALGTSLISGGASATVVTTAATGAATTDSIEWSFNAAPGTGYTAGLYVLAYPTSGNVNFLVVNPTAGNLTPAAATINWRVIR